MRRLPVLAMLGVLLSLLAVPSSAVTDEGILLRGSRSSYVDLYVYENTTITASDVHLAGKGSYVGFFLSPAPANRPTVGALVMPRVGATDATSSDRMTLGESWDVQAGKYRAYLITDGPAEVWVPIAGQGFRAYVPRYPAPVSVRRADFDVPAGSPGVSRAYPVATRVRSLLVAAELSSSASLTAVETLGACITTGSASCPTTIEANARMPAGRAWTYAAALLPAGSYRGELDVLRRLAGADAGSHVDGAVVVMTLGVQT